MHVHSPICQGLLIEKIRPIILIVWVLGRIKKKRQKRVTHVSISIFQGLFKNIVFRSVTLVKKSYGLFFFFTQTGLFTTLLHFPMHKKNFTKNLLNFYLLKAKNFHGDSVKNESARAKNLFRVNPLFKYYLCWVPTSQLLDYCSVYANDTLIFSSELFYHLLSCIFNFDLLRKKFKFLIISCKGRL